MEVHLDMPHPLKKNNNHIRVTLPATILLHFEPVLNTTSALYRSLNTAKQVLECGRVHSALTRVGESIQRAVEPGTEYTWSFGEEMVEMSGEGEEEGDGRRGVGEQFGFTMTRGGIVPNGEAAWVPGQVLVVRCLEVRGDVLECSAKYFGEEEGDVVNKWDVSGMEEEMKKGQGEGGGEKGGDVAPGTAH